MNPLFWIDSIRLASVPEQSLGRTPGETDDDDTGDKIRRLHCRILVVDDTPSFLKAFASRLREVYEAHVEEAANAHLAMEKLTEMEAFDIVLVDVEMPVEDGIAACRKMRSSGVFGRIILMSSNADNEERASAIGVEFLEKSDDDVFTPALEKLLLGCKDMRS